MAKFQLRFIDCTCDGDSEYIKVNALKTNSLSMGTIIELSIFQEGDEEERIFWLDKSTAIKFAKTLRTEINKITESEVSNG